MFEIFFYQHACLYNENCTFHLDMFTEYWRDSRRNPQSVQDCVGDLPEDRDQDGRWSRSIHWPESVSKHPHCRAQLWKADKHALLRLEVGMFYLGLVWTLVDVTNSVQLVQLHVYKTRPSNINWQDWKYALFVIFICNGQIMRCHSAMGED